MNTLESLLYQHINPTIGTPAKYHAQVEVELDPNNLGELIITWNCHYCRQIYKMAQVLNQQHNAHARAMNHENPMHLGFVQEHTTMTDPFRLPFDTFPIQNIRAMVSTLAAQAYDPEHPRGTVDQDIAMPRPGGINGQPIQTVPETPLLNTP